MQHDKFSLWLKNHIFFSEENGLIFKKRWVIISTYFKLREFIKRHV